MPHRDFTAFINALTEPQKMQLMEELLPRIRVQLLADLMLETLPQEDCTELCVKLSEGAEK